MKDRSRMRALNALLSAVMLALFLIHGVGNAFQMIGVGSTLSKMLSRILLVVCIIHAVIGVVLTLDTLHTQKEAGVSYPGHNKRFWAVRVSGFCIAILMAFHAISFLQPSTEPVRLAYFGTVQLVGNILLVVAIAVHVLTNMAPMMVSLGVPLPRARALDMILSVSVLLVFMVIAFVIYYLRWMAV